jgi:hypothetical protein
MASFVCPDCRQRKVFDRAIIGSANTEGRHGPVSTTRS